jgi:hypothetical protein
LELAMTDDLRQQLQQLIAQRFWQVDRHHRAPLHVRVVVESMMQVRIVEHQPNALLALVPNELMFEIFAHLPYNNSR